MGMKKETKTPTLPENNPQPLDKPQESALPPLPALPSDDASPAEMEAAADRYLRYHMAKTERDALDKIVFSLENALVGGNPGGMPDFPAMLAVNAQALNAAFEYYLTRAHQSPAGDAKILMALRMQTQLTRTIDTWRRFANFQNDQTK